MELFTAIATLAQSGERLYEEDGSGIYRLETSDARRELDRLLGPQAHRALREVIMPKLGRDSLYLITVGRGGREIYRLACPQLGYVSTILLAKALTLDGEFLRPARDEMTGRGLPKFLITIDSGYDHIPDGWFGYHLAIRPKPIRVDKGIYYDEETGAGVAVSMPSVWEPEDEDLEED